MQSEIEKWNILTSYDYISYKSVVDVSPPTPKKWDILDTRLPARHICWQAKKYDSDIHSRSLNSF